MPSMRLRPGPAAAAGVLLALPFLVLDLVVSQRIEPVFSLIRPGVHTGPHEYALLAAVLLLVPAGAAVALLPLRRDHDGRRRFPPLNVVLAALLLAGFALVAGTLGEEVYRCDVLGVPDCD